MDIVGLAEVVSAVAVLVGFGFAVSEVTRHRRTTSRESAFALVESYRTVEFAQALTLMVDLPPGLSKAELDERLGSDMKLVALLMTTWESLGILLFRGEVDIELVDDFFSGPIDLSWNRLEGYVQELRGIGRRETYFEWFQWLAERMAERESETRPVPAHIQHRGWSEQRRLRKRW